MEGPIIWSLMVGGYLARPRLRGGQHSTIRIIPITARRNKITFEKEWRTNSPRVQYWLWEKDLQTATRRLTRTRSKSCGWKGGMSLTGANFSWRADFIHIREQRHEFKDSFRPVYQTEFVFSGYFVRTSPPDFQSWRIWGNNLFDATLCTRFH